MAFKRLRIHDSIRSQAGKAMKSSKNASLIEELRTLVDAVENVTRGLVTREQQQQLFISRINTISDVRTLNLLTEVCEVDHPAFSDAASVRAEVVSFTMTRKANVSDWIDNATHDLDESREEVTDDMENWDLADFRRQYLALLNVQAIRSRTESGKGEASEVRGGSRGDDNGSDEIEGEEHVENIPDATGNETSSTGTYSEIELSYALSYINKLKKRFRNRPEVYKQFLEILRMYQHESLPLQRVHVEVTELLRTEEDLVEEFKVFLPEPMNQAEKHAQLSSSVVDDTDKSSTEPLPLSQEVKPTHVSLSLTARAVNTIVPETAPLSEIAMGLDMNDAETLRYYSELSMYKYSTRRDTLAFSTHLGAESRNKVADIAERFGLIHDRIVLGNDTVQLIVRRPCQDSDDIHDGDYANTNNDDQEEDGDRVFKSTIEESIEAIEPQGLIA
ncbi:hypothetical protein F5Y03DRAFT_409600 [Xylaria venustula]|nr:hypothetical protein F5Y03DRAFT_409600 [Xylaria venustula]